MNVPDNDRGNQEQFLELLKTVDPELAVIKDMLILTKLPSLTLIKIINSIGKVNSGTGYGKITLSIHGHTVNHIDLEEKIKLS